jgi:hypothetical protein
MPKRLLKRRFLPELAAAVLILLSLLVTAWSLHSRSNLVDDILYKNCVANENQDAVIVSILLSIPPQRRSQVIQDAINTLEPPDEPDCTPPKGAFP